MKLLDAADQVRFAANWAKHLPANRRFVADHADFPAPPAHILFDAFGNTDLEGYRRSGSERAPLIAECITRHNGDGPQRVLEWGCGPARVLRHLGASLPAGSTVAGSDYNKRTIGWCHAHIDGIRFETNELAPPTKFDDDSFDAVYSISVLTHLSEAVQHEWLAELVRITRPGGIVLLTVKGESFRKILLPEEQARFDEGKMVERGGVLEGKKFYGAFHPDRFMRDDLLKELDVVEHLPMGIPGMDQDIWIARTPA